MKRQERRNTEFRGRGAYNFGVLSGGPVKEPG
jgi:hypothetical protein